MKNPIDHNLPKELILEIILRLPVKSLLRFKCVSTEWNTLIGSTSFANQHFAHESNPELLLTKSYKAEEQKYVFMLYLDDKLSRREEPDHLQIPDTVKDIIGPVNGVFCLINDFEEIALLNPAMRQFRLLPDLVTSSYNYQPQFSLEDQKFGFGLDPSSGDFKLVSVEYLWDDENEDSYYPCLISVYNSGSDSWRHFEEKDFVNSDRKICESVANTYLNGVYYWLIELSDDGDDDGALSILAFDMRSEEFREIERTDALAFPHVKLALYCGSLALLYYDCRHIAWVLEYDGTWSSLCWRGPVGDPGRPLGFWNDSVIYLLDKNSSQVSRASNTLYIMIVMNSDDRVYDPFFAIVRSSRDRAIDEDLCWIVVYKESLVSIKGHGDKCYSWDTSSDVVKDFFQESP